MAANGSAPSTARTGTVPDKITDPDAKKTYDGVMTVSGNTVTMKAAS
jgi:uncharacterized protein (DUF2147 family)